MYTGSQLHTNITVDYDKLVYSDPIMVLLYIRTQLYN